MIDNDYVMDDFLLVDDYMVREKSSLFDRNKQGRPDSRQQDKWLKQQSCTGHGHVVVPTRLPITNNVMVIGESLHWRWGIRKGGAANSLTSLVSQSW